MTVDNKTLFWAIVIVIGITVLICYYIWNPAEYACEKEGMTAEEIYYCKQSYK